MKKNLKELKLAYLASGDITEYRFANECFGDFETWSKFAEANHNLVSMWRKELEMKLKEEALSTVTSIMRENPKESLSAAKFLLQKGILSRTGEPMVTEEEIKERVAPKIRREEADFLRLVKKDA